MCSWKLFVLWRVYFINTWTGHVKHSIIKHYYWPKPSFFNLLNFFLFQILRYFVSHICNIYNLCWEPWYKKKKSVTKKMGWGEPCNCFSRIFKKQSRPVKFTLKKIDNSYMRILLECSLAFWVLNLIFFVILIITSVARKLFNKICK